MNSQELLSRVPSQTALLLMSVTLRQDDQFIAV